MRELIHWADQYPTITFTLSKEDTAAAEIWRGWIPFNTLFWDHRPGQRVLPGFIMDMAAGTLPPGASVRYLADARLSPWIQGYNPRKQIRSGVAIEVSLLAGTPALIKIPVVLYCIPCATDMLTTNMPPPMWNVNDWDVRDIQDGDFETHWTLIPPYIASQSGP